MSLTDLNGPRSLEPRTPRQRRSFSSLQLLSFSAVILALATLGVSAAPAQGQDQTQSVAEAARQERARKDEQKTASQQKSARHIYTEEDLKRQHILTPEDEAVVAAKKTECARKNNCAPAAQNSPATLDAKSQGPSLGELARQLRKQKELQALQPKQSEPFHLSIGTPALASPVLPERPGARMNVPAFQPPSPVTRPIRRIPEAPVNNLRRDPFAPLPTRPRVPFSGKSELRQAVRPVLHTNALASPKISPPPFSSTLTFGSAQPAMPASKPAARSSAMLLDSAKRGAHAFEILPVHPTISKSRVTSIPAPKNLFYFLKPVAPLTVSVSQPTAPALILVPSSSAPSSTRTVRVARGDSLWKLARRNFGRASLWPAIAAANPSVTDPSHIRAGVELVLPAVAKGETLLPSPATSSGKIGQAITVHTGDTLWSLAKSTLGRAIAWPCLAAANPSVANPNRISTGQVLQLPTGCPAAPSGALLPDER